jgi:hypothetical protein
MGGDPFSFILRYRLHVGDCSGFYRSLWRRQKAKEDDPKAPHATVDIKQPPPPLDVSDDEPDGVVQRIKKRLPHVRSQVGINGNRFICG